MAINKKLIHFNTFENFNSKKLSANIENTKYTLGVDGEIQTGSPDILYLSIVYIKDTKQLWTHGLLYVSDANIQAVDTSEILDDVETNTYIKYVAQTLTEEQKQQSRDNIEAASIEDLSTKFQESKNYIDTKISEINTTVEKLSSSTLLEFYCIKPVDIMLNDLLISYPANFLVSLSLNINDEFEILPSENDAIISLTSFPGAIDTFYPWLEGVKLFNNILFNMNNEDLYTKWSQGQQGQYNVQYALYTNCIFWSDLAYISDVNKRTNYTLYNTSELPLCYSSIPENTFKSFYCAYGVTTDPNWSNPLYKNSFALATHPTQVFSYYGLHSIGIFDMDASYFNITLPKDCRGLMYNAGNILNAGVFDAVNVTNFGAKSGSWRDAFGGCHMLKNLRIKNLKVNINISWSPINQESIEYILNKAANTNNITISLSPYTYYTLTDANKALAAEKNITLELISTNLKEDNRLKILKSNGDGTKFLSDNGQYKEIKTINGNSILGSGNIVIPQIIYIPNESSMPETPVEGVYYMIGEEDPHEFYCTFEALENDLTVSFSKNTIQYSTDNCQTWNELTADTTTPVINSGDKISFKATGLVPDERGGIGTFTVNKNFNLKGNVMSMLFGDEGNNSYDLTGYDYAFAGLFNECTTLQSVSKDFLPATTLSYYCYESMFNYCKSLVNAPALPATALAEECYSYMFQGCTSLVTAPELPATTLADNCYCDMFYGCTSLVTSPELPATALTEECYSEMFSYCESLTTAPELPATTLTTSCYYGMFSGCSSLTTAPELPATELAYACYEFMFNGCSSLVTAPELPATTLTTSCYYGMFSGCSSLVNAPELPATTLADNCYCDMFNGCTSLNYIKALFTTEPGEDYTTNWVSDVSPTGTFVKNASATWDVTGVNGIPEGWTVQLQ